MSSGKSDWSRLYAISDQIHRGEELSAEDRRYLQEFLIAARPTLDAFAEAMKTFADAFTEACREAGRLLLVGGTSEPDDQCSCGAFPHADYCPLDDVSEGDR